MPGAAFRVSGQRLVGRGAVGPPSRSVPPSPLSLEVARALSSRCTVGGAWVGGGHPAALSPPTLSRPSSGPTGRGGHLRRLLCGGWGFGGGGYRRR